jgi:hypothetical protein
MDEKLIAIDWTSHLQSNIFLGFTTPNGEPRVEISDDYLFKAPVSWLFRPTTVGYQEIKALVLRMSEAGLITHWKQKSLREMKVKANLPQVEEEENSSIKALPVQDLSAVFLLLLMLYALSAVVFVLEVLWECFKMTKFKEND